uniref:Uncharacterized protein n=1 Tax=Arundo donax TaxID=35708 RepID=A0A0A9BCB4_ARUDO
MVRRSSTRVRRPSTSATSRESNGSSPNLSFLMSSGGKGRYCGGLWPSTSQTMMPLHGSTKPSKPPSPRAMTLDVVW